jgi:hypothetical protein
LGLITAAFTNVKFQIDSTEGGDQLQVTACSTAGVSGSGPCTANRRLRWVAMEPLTWSPLNLSATNHYLDIAATKGNVLLDELQAFDPL